MGDTPSLDVLRANYTAVQLYIVASPKGCPLKDGTHLVFWVCGDGSQTLVYTTMGQLCVLRNDGFSVNGIHGAIEHAVADGRLVYRTVGVDGWLDVGPIKPDARNDARDLPVAAMRHALQQSDTPGVADTTEIHCRMRKRPDDKLSKWLM